ncbi:alpha/beta hydrolase [Pseudorhodoplanes sp.]|uniref:alpha/beta fold hydrolase n=1 Tax=Pseudorhodoplanes sp. TaxID=1934341 RepID=UPI002CA0CB61|nr:alpha/beta hydrolase [Pseudorhodoplanes sp.]HWV55042.1 alpha/beta hydrolase [Pseudorhodoplanes sp.]
MKTQVVRVRGPETEVLECGNGSPLLFLHSGAGPNTHSTEYLERLGERFRVIAPFHPGFGSLPRPRSFRSVSDIAYFYLDLIAQWRLHDVVLVGAGLGGWIASEIAIRTTAPLSRLVLVSPFGIKVGGREERDFVDVHAMSPEQRAALEFNTPAYASIDYSGKTDAELTILARGREAEAHYGWEPYMHNPSLRQWLHRINVPVTLLRGADERVIARRNHEAYVDEIPDCELLTIDGAGHHPHLDAPADFVTAVIASGASRKPSVVAV